MAPPAGAAPMHNGRAPRSAQPAASPSPRARAPHRLHAVGLVVLLALPLLAGCLWGADTSGKPGTVTTSSTTFRQPTITRTTPPRTFTTTTTPPVGPDGLVLPLLQNFDLPDCTGALFDMPAPLEALQSRLPEGFTAAPRTDPLTGVPSATEGSARIDIYRCVSLRSSPSTPGTRAFATAPTYFGHVAIAVQPPEKSVFPQVPTEGDHEYMLRVLSQGDILTRLWQAAGYRTPNGTANVTVRHLPSALGLPGPPTAAAIDARDAGYRIAGEAVARTMDLKGPFARYTRHADGSLLVWTGMQERPVTYAGQGDADVPGADPLAGLGPVFPNRLPGELLFVEKAQFTGQNLVKFILPK